jgi:mycofactocin precursor
MDMSGQTAVAEPITEPAAAEPVTTEPAPSPAPVTVADVLVEEVSIDGMCGVY